MNYTLKHKDMNIAVFTTRNNPGKEVIRCIFDKHLTDEKTKFLKELQIEYNKGTNMEDYIQNIINRENHKREEQSLDDDMIQIFDDNFLL